MVRKREEKKNDRKKEKLGNIFIHEREKRRGKR